MDRTRILIMGAAGRDFHDFNVVYRDDSERRGRRVHRDPDPRNRRSPLPARAGRAALSERGIPILPEQELERIIRDERIDTVVFAYSDVSHETVMHAASRALAAGADFTPPRPGPDDAQEPPAGPRRGRHPDRRRQEPDDPLPGRPAGRPGPHPGRHPPPDAVRRSRRPARRALRDLRGPRPVRDDDRGARGVRAAPRRRPGRLRRRRLRGDPAPGRARGRRHPVGRRQQRLPVLPAGPVRRGRRPAAPRRRASLPPGRDEPADGRRRDHQQDRLGRAGRDRRRPGLDPRAQPAGRRRHRTVRPDPGRSARSRASASSSSRTARRSPTAACRTAPASWPPAASARPRWSTRARPPSARSARCSIATRRSSRSSRRWATARPRSASSRRPSTRSTPISSCRRRRST